MSDIDPIYILISIQLFLDPNLLLIFEGARH